MITFRKLLELAQDGGKPVQVHARGAERDCLDTISTFDLKSVLMHWFESEKRLSEVMAKGYLVSFGPSIIYSKKLQRMAVAANHDQVLVETDSPVSFAPLGRVSGPTLVPSVVFKIAELWGETFDEARALIARNSARFLGLPGKG
jgi:TatD DNase family protein